MTRSRLEPTPANINHCFMASFQTCSTKGIPVTVIYPAERRSDNRTQVSFRIGKKSVLPAYTDASTPHLVQFQCGQRTITFMLSDLFEPSYWKRIRNAYNVLGQLDLDEETKVGVDETEKVLAWLKLESLSLGVVIGSEV